jgi:glycosyltransferase involved in cell wall biosynthesis
MTTCRFCRSNTGLTACLTFSDHGTYEARECPACGLASLYPFPKPDLLKRLMDRHRDEWPGFDPNFEWRLFFARRHLHDSARVLSIGPEDKVLAASFAREKITLVQIETIDAGALNGLGNGEFDAVFIWDMVNFVEDFRAFFKAIRRLVKEGGHVALRCRDAYSTVNMERSQVNLMKGAPNFLSRRFILGLHREFFGDRPHCFTQEISNDSTLVTLGKVNSGTPRDYEMDVLVIVHHYLFSKLDDATGPRGRVLNTIETLDRRGVKADVSLSLSPNAAGYDLVHVFHNAWETQDALAQVTAVKGSNARIAVSTIYMDPSETNFVINTINEIFKIPGTGERDAHLAVLAEGKLRAGELRQGMRWYSRWNVEEDQRALLEMVDRIICFSHTEMRQISLNLNRTPPFSIVYNSANDETFGVEDRSLFEESYGVTDFVVAAGHVEWRKNQLMLLYALRHNPEIPIVIVGAKTDEEYFDLCRLWAHKNTIFIPQLKHRHLASAFAAARVHAQPSWIEGISLSAIEAAMCGCTPVVADRAGEIEYYGGLGQYANPGSVDSIRRAVLTAFHRHTPEVRKSTSDYVKSRYTFKKAVEMTIDAYRSTLGQGA